MNATQLRRWMESDEDFEEHLDDTVRARGLQLVTSDSMDVCLRTGGAGRPIERAWTSYERGSVIFLSMRLRPGQWVELSSSQGVPLQRRVSAPLLRVDGR